MNFNLSKLTICLLLGYSQISKAQLSTRENNPSVLKVGTRPAEGNFGFSLIGSSKDLEQFVNNNDSITSEEKKMMPLFVFRYYLSDQLVLRAGIKYERSKEKKSGDIDPNVNGPGFQSRSNINSSTSLLITPGAEYHFIQSNILDPYMTVSLPIGLMQENVVKNDTYEYGDFMNHSMRKSSLVYGWQVHFGLQAFVADLPLAIGLEFGAIGLGYLGDKYKHNLDYSLGGSETSQTYYTFKDDPSNIKYSNLKSNSFDLSSEIRLSINYFFSK
ncbi:MAG: hypothetical protein ACK5P4_12075 [Bacteroidota bacterium]|jgi:hypothetical protein